MTFHDATTGGLLQTASKFEFITELAPKVWKVSRKVDRVEYLAYDITDQLVADDVGTKSGFHQLLNAHEMLEPLKSILNHEHLMSLVDIFAVQTTDYGKFGLIRTYAVWDFCNAGNLGNLLIWNPTKPTEDRDAQPKKEEEDVKTEDEDSEDEEEEAQAKKAGSGEAKKGEDGKVKLEDPDFPVPGSPGYHPFLPESLCWHVLCSLMKALAWLHDGNRDMIMKDGKYEFATRDKSWQTILHRRISPKNIFLGHPSRNEDYGMCKLGNYGAVVVTNHSPRDPSETNEKIFGEAMSSTKRSQEQNLSTAVRKQVKMQNMWPHQPDQPYTVLSEYRAVGEILLGMMVRPTTENHMAFIRTKLVQAHLKLADYSPMLKNYVLKIMGADPWIRKPDGSFRFDNSARTSALCLESWAMYQEWKKGWDEGKELVSAEDALAAQIWDDKTETFRLNTSVYEAQQAAAKLDDKFILSLG